MSTMPSTFIEEGRFEKNPNDFFQTPLPCAVAILKAFHDRYMFPQWPYTIWDAGAGTGQWGRAAKQVWPDTSVIGIDIDVSNTPDEVYDLVLEQDFLTLPADTTKYGCDLIIGNPPYSAAGNKKLAADFVETALSFAPAQGVLFLMKTEFLGSQDRYHRLFNTITHRPQHIWQLASRPSWNGTGNSNTIEYAAFYWNANGWNRDTTISWLDWKYGT